MKKLLSLFLAMCMLISVCFSAAGSAYAASQEWDCGTGVKAVFDGNSTLTVSGSGAINDYASVYDTPWNDMSINFKIQTLVIGNGITAIGTRAFSSLLSLQNVTIAPTVTSIGERAFSGSRMITSIDIPASVEFIGDAAFRTASTSVGADLTAINVNSANQNYASVNGILYDKSMKTLIQIPSSTAVTELVIPDTVTTINTQAGVNCRNIEKVLVSAKVTEIKDLTFAKCSSLREVTLPASVSVISINAFQDCDSLEKIVISNKSCTIPDGAIPNASGVTIYGIKDSTAQQYANNNNIDFKLINADDDNDIPFEPTHTHNYTTVVTPPTCLEQGYTTHTCTDTECGDSYVDNYVPATGHSPVTDKAVAATCTTAGKTAGSHCSVCGVVITAQKTVTATGHKYVTATTKATTSKAGTTVTKCSVCGAVKASTSIAYPKTVTLSATSYTYSGKANMPTVTVKDSAGKTISASNYDVTYSNNTNVGTATAKVTFKSTSNYSGSISKTFKILPKNTSISGVTSQYKGFTVSLKKYTTQTTGYQIQYSTSSKFTSAKTVNISNATTSKTVTGLTAKKKYYIRARTYKKVGSAYYYSSWSSAKSVTTSSYPTTIALSSTSYTYNGKVKKPSVTVKNNGKKVSSKYYTVTYSKGRKSVGVYTVKITFKKPYSGTVKKTFTIRPKSTTISSITAKSKGFTVKWKKQATQTTGYQIQYSTSSNFANAKAVNVSNNKTTSKTVSKLTGKKKYYVRIRTYKTIGSTKIYSSWSKAKAVTTKK